MQIIGIFFMGVAMVAAFALAILLTAIILMAVWEAVN